MNMGQIIHVMNFQRLEKNFTSIKKQLLDEQLKQFNQLTQIGHFPKHISDLLVAP